MFFAVFLSTIIVVPIVLAAGTELDRWHPVMNSTNKSMVFDALDASIPAWPKVHSAEFIAGMEKDTQKDQIEFHSIGHNIIHDAKTLLEDMPQHSPTENWRRLNAALTLRDSMLQNVGYANLVLADGLNRLVFVFLCKELGSEKQVSPEYEKALSHLMTYDVNMDQWQSVIKDELGWPDKKFKDVVDNHNPEVGLRKLWNLLTDGDNFAIPKNIAHLCTDDLLKQRDLSMLLYRYIYIDSATKSLFLAVQYKKQAETFTLDDRGDKIANVLSVSRDGHRISLVKTGEVHQVVVTPVSFDKTQLRVGERFLNQRITADDVATLLQQIKSGRIEKFMPYYLSDVSSYHNHP